MSLDDFLEQSEFASFIDGMFIRHPGAVRQNLVSPVIQENWKVFFLAEAEQTHEAIYAAESALPLWKNLSPYQRAEYLKQIAVGLRKNSHLLATVMAMEMGKTLKDGQAEVEYAAGFYDWFAGEALRTYGLEIPASSPSKKLALKYDPVGVCAILTPWNFPLAMPARKIAAALAAGCTTVCRPSLDAPLSLLCIAEIARQAGLPRGVLNVVCGQINDIVDPLLNSSLVRKLSFTGSTTIGKELYAKSACTLKKLTLELGGLAPFIVLNDADVAKAVKGALQAKFRNNGQSCIAANRFFIQEGIYPRFLDSLVGEVAKLKSGHPLDPSVDLSSLLHPSSFKKFQEHFQDALKKGARVIYQGKDLPYPLILENCHPEMKIFKEETFGPLLGLTTFSTIEEAIFLANQTSYGLAAYVYTSHLDSAQRLIDELKFGIIGLNDGLPSCPQAAFGGVKDSGIGREGGPDGIYEYLQAKFVSTNYA